MKVCRTLICCFFLSALQDGNTGLVNAGIVFYPGTEGGDVTVKCSFSSSGTWKIFCKEPCKTKDVLIQTADIRAQSGRYSIRYEEGLISGGDIIVTITQLNKSDSGRYRCVSGRTWSPASYEQLEIIVPDAELHRNQDREEKRLIARSGGSLTVACTFTFSGNKFFFCKNKCEENNVLVETSGDRAQSGRYSIRYSSSLTRVFLYVSITQLSRSDSGQYRCGVERYTLDSYIDFDVFVTDAPSTSTPNVTVQPFSTSTPTTAQSLRTSSGCFTPSSAVTEATDQSDQPQTGRPATDVTLYVGLTLVAMVVLLSVVVLIFCRKRMVKPKEPPMETEYAPVTEMNQLYEEIREEDRESRSPPLEISSLYTYAQCTKPNGVEASDVYSFISAAASQDKAEDDSSKLTYSEVDFSNIAVCSDGSLATDAAPLYSTVALHQ